MMSMSVVCVVDVGAKGQGRVERKAPEAEKRSTEITISRSSLSPQHDHYTHIYQDSRVQAEFATMNTASALKLSCSSNVDAPVNLSIRLLGQNEANHEFWAKTAR